MQILHKHCGFILWLLYCGLKSAAAQNGFGKMIHDRFKGLKNIGGNSEEDPRNAHKSGIQQVLDMFKPVTRRPGDSFFWDSHPAYWAAMVYGVVALLLLVNLFALSVMYRRNIVAGVEERRTRRQKLREESSQSSESVKKLSPVSDADSIEADSAIALTASGDSRSGSDECVGVSVNS